MINHGIIRIFNEVRISSSPCDIVINHDIIRIFKEVLPLIDIKKRKCSLNCIHVVIISYDNDNKIMVEQRINSEV